MSGYKESCGVERIAMDSLVPFIEKFADNGRIVRIENGALAEPLQKIAGDVLVECQGKINGVQTRVLKGIEIKAEERHTGNLFLETWSNKNLDDAFNHAQIGSKEGWLKTIRADCLWYYFLDTGDLYVIDLLRLKQWAFGVNEKPGNIYRFKEVPQKKYNQKNDTYGRLVPIEVLKKEVGVKHFSVPPITPPSKAA